MTRLNVGNIRHPDGTNDNISLDSSGRVLVGTSSARSNYRWAEVSSDYTPSYQVEGTGANANQSIAITNNAADNYPPILFLGKSRGSSVGSNTVVPDGERIGQVVFAGNDGTRFLPAARIEAVADGTPGSNDMPGRLVFSTTADGASSPTERMRLDSSGNLKFNSGFGSVGTAYGVRAWVNFDGTGTAAIKEDGGISSFTDVDTGKYIIGFATTMPDANYCPIMGVCNDSYAGTVLSLGQDGPTGSLYSKTTTQLQFRVSKNGGDFGVADVNEVSIAIIR